LYLDCNLLLIFPIKSKLQSKLLFEYDLLTKLN
jgi:hypothetical protein